LQLSATLTGLIFPHYISAIIAAMQINMQAAYLAIPLSVVL